ncbi:MAG: hypothetical protein JW742_02700, partial [Candidatus Aminicenantes bacterium]|nr:hypothetical protein [Candidatus Aminicenantes bacterium]
MSKKGLLSPLAVLLLAACAVRQAALPPALPAAAPEPPAPRIPVEDMIAEAETLFERGGYVHLRRAFSVYRELEEAGVDRSRFAAGYAGTALLLAARAREMGIRTSEPLSVARELIRSEAAPAALESAAEVVSRLPVKTLGVWADASSPAAVPDEESPDRERPSPDFEAGPADRPLFAYLRALHREQAGQTDEAKADLAESLKTFPGSLLL